MGPHLPVLINASGDRLPLWLIANPHQCRPMMELVEAAAWHSSDMSSRHIILIITGRFRTVLVQMIIVRVYRTQASCTSTHPRRHHVAARKVGSILHARLQQCALCP